ncbi:NUDIX domain-containing protein [Ascidiimonas aurantiaca]|uniref:NUDIX domain-containing protein n=1 Tax=Ascidiimonas aurantiaca TaxID=1685432 RepID=UPI0030EDEDDF
MNKKVRNQTEQVLSNNWYTLKKVNFEYQLENGSWQSQSREVYDRGNGAAVLLYNKTQNSIILTRQFRMPTYVNGNSNGMMIEVCAGLLDGDSPEKSIKKEILEETGYHIETITKVFEAYMSPGAVTEILHFFIAEYDAAMKKDAGGGNPNETEYIETIEIPFETACDMIATGDIKDAKTIMLLQYAKINNLL